MAFSPDGRLLLTGSWDRTARLWEASTGRPVGAVLRHTEQVVSVGFSPDGRTALTAAADGTTQRWDVVTGEARGQPFQRPGGAGGSAIFGPDGRTLLMAQGDARARLADLLTRRMLGPPLPHYAGIPSVAFSPDGRSLLTLLAGRRAAQLWRVPAPLAGGVEQLVRWTEVITGMELDRDGIVHALDAGTWHRRRLRLEELGGPPDAATSPDPEPGRLRIEAAESSGR